jgi:hypothetical protein
MELSQRRTGFLSCPCSIWKGDVMKKKLMALAAVATLAVSAVALPQAAEARGGRIAAALLPD